MNIPERNTKVFKDIINTEYKSFIRDQKIGEVIGEKTEIFSKKRKVIEQLEPKWIPVVGQLLGLYDTYSSSNVKVLKVTPKTFQYTYLCGSEKVYTCRLQKSGSWGSFNQKTYTYEELKKRREDERQESQYR